jgi:hypothetical protein
MEVDMGVKTRRTLKPSIASKREPTTAVERDEHRETTPFTGPRSTGRSLLEHLKTVPKWSGDDFEERLDEVVRTRGDAQS